jgi:hypothetical protein
VWVWYPLAAGFVGVGNGPLVGGCVWVRWDPFETSCDRKSLFSVNTVLLPPCITIADKTISADKATIIADQGYHFC